MGYLWKCENVEPDPNFIYPNCEVISLAELNAIERKQFCNVGIFAEIYGFCEVNFCFARLFSTTKYACRARLEDISLYPQETVWKFLQDNYAELIKKHINRKCNSYKEIRSYFFELLKSGIEYQEQYDCTTCEVKYIIDWLLSSNVTSVESINASLTATLSQNDFIPAIKLYGLLGGYIDRFQDRYIGCFKQIPVLQLGFRGKEYCSQSVLHDKVLHYVCEKEPLSDIYLYRKEDVVNFLNSHKTYSALMKEKIGVHSNTYENIINRIQTIQNI